MISSFHHSDTSWDFNFNDSFSDIPVYDEATVPTTPTSPMKLPWEESPTTDKKKKKKKKLPRKEVDLNASWPSARHLFAKVPANSNNEKNSNTVSSSEPTKEQSQQIRVRFAPTKEIRTHNVVLGDHPMCEDGLALQLGWDYEESRDILSPLRTVHKESAIPRWRRILRPNAPSSGESGEAKLLSVEERKKRLKEVGGCTEAELEKRRFCARFLLDYAFYEPPEGGRPPFTPKPQTMPQQHQPTSQNGFSRRSSNGRQDQPLPATIPRANNNNNINRNSETTPIANPRRRFTKRRSAQPQYAARMA